MTQKLKAGNLVEINVQSPWQSKASPEWVPGEVDELLATQFTAVIPAMGVDKGERVVYRFYAHRNETWRLIDE